MTDAEPRILPEMVPLHRVAKELGKATSVLVAASREGRFCPLVRVGAVWFVKLDEVKAWFDRQHAKSVQVTPADRERIRQAGRAEATGSPARRRHQPRARTAASS